MMDSMFGIVTTASQKDPEAPSPLNLFETVMYHGLERPANWFRRHFEKQKLIRLTSPSRKGVPPTGRGLRKYLDSKYARVSASSRGSNSSREFLMSRKTKAYDNFKGMWDDEDFGSSRGRSRSQTSLEGTDLGGRRYIVRDLDGHKFDIYDNKKNKVVREFSRMDDAMSQCYYLNWEYERSIRRPGWGNKAGGILFGLAQGALNAVVPVLVKGKLDWWIRKGEYKSWKNMSRDEQEFMMGGRPGSYDDFGYDRR